MRASVNFLLGTSVGAALLAACAATQSPIGTPGAIPQTPNLAPHDSRVSYTVVYSFAGGADAANPFAGLIDVHGTLYGTTVAGGTYSCTTGELYGCGTVYSVTPSGTERVVHDFGAGTDGRNPRAGLLDVDGTLYGTTTAGGSSACYGSYYSNCGTVFSISPSVAENTLHTFTGYPGDGAYPRAGLLTLHGTLYGTTAVGGAGECYYSGRACGTVFSLTETGTEKVLRAFTGHPDGAFPQAALIDVDGMLYGTTADGGVHGFGTIFRMAPDGTERVLHSFGAGSDGRHPYASLIELKGKLYGTTAAGGVYGCGSEVNCGTVFSFTPGGAEKVLHNFGHRHDGADPEANLTDLNGTLYGTTASGGKYSCGSNCGYGTLFSITPEGTEKVLHDFGRKRDGAFPHAGLLDVNGTLYGTTAAGAQPAMARCSR